MTRSLEFYKIRKPSSDLQWRVLGTAETMEMRTNYGRQSYGMSYSGNYSETYVKSYCSANVSENFDPAKPTLARKEYGGARGIQQGWRNTAEVGGIAVRASGGKTFGGVRASWARDLRWQQSEIADIFMISLTHLHLWA